MNIENEFPLYTVREISLPIREDPAQAVLIAKRTLLRFFSEDDISDIRISKRAVDARKKNDIRFVYGVTAAVTSRKRISGEKLSERKISVEYPAGMKISQGDEIMRARPVVVGFGPCGMFCAYILAGNGYRPIIIERGSDTVKRRRDVENFKSNQVLNTESNIQFGAGGAGTFSDGKLMTRINDPLSSFVIKTFCGFGAPEDILYEAKPHIGTDYLCTVVDGFRDELLRLGADIYFDTKLTGMEISAGNVKKIYTTSGDMECGVLIPAIGHSARDTLSVLRGLDFDIVPKAFSVGVRIEHLQKNIDHAMFGKESESGLLPHAEYNVSAHIGGRGVYSFCMCPGGEVACAASEAGGIVTNGMSRHGRDGKNANSALCVSVLPEDYGNSISGAVDFVRKIEQKAYAAAGNTYFAPAQSVGSFLGKTAENKITTVMPSYMDGKVTMTDVSGIFPEFIGNALRAALPEFDRKISGFADDGAILTSPETRTSSPVRIVRGENYLANGFDNIYPCGEGAGYAGGITSAAIDGIKCALEIIGRYKPAK